MLSGGALRRGGLLREFTIAAFRVRDQGTVLGFLWTLLHPLLMLLILYALFQGQLGERIPNFRSYLLIGITHWSFFATATSKAVTSIVQRRELVSNFPFPRALLVLSDVGAVLISFVLELVVLLLFLVWDGVPLRWAALALPLVVAVEAVLVTGVGLALACAQVFVKDTERIWGILLRIGFFLVPIFYPVALLAEGPKRAIYLLNPLTQLMAASRELLLEGRVPAAAGIAWTVACAAGLLAGAFALFRRLEPRFAERL